jgi:nitric oxide dioxygenase
VVAGRQQESPDTVAFSLRAVDGSALPAAKPGQYISVTVPLPDGANQIRQYSLTRGRADDWAISVRAVPATIAEDGTEIPEGEVSNFLHRNVFEGDELRVSLPFGDLVLDEGDDPLLLVSAGIGCTPIIGMLHYLTHTSTERLVTVLHADRSPAR